MDSDSDASSGEFSQESFRVVRRHCPSPKKLRPDTDQLEGTDAVSVPTPTMAALSPDTPSSPMSGDAQIQPRLGTEQHGADTVAAPMALEWRSQDPLLPRGRQLFAMIADLPTVQEKLEEKISSSSQANAVVEEKEEVRCAEEKRSSGPDEPTGVVMEQAVYLIEEQRSGGSIEADEVLEEMEEDASSDDNSYCASCNDPYKENAFWIRCDSCGKWYHGKCVKITSSQAERIKKYECPDCRDERTGHA